MFRYKIIVAEAVVEYLKPIQENIAKYRSSPEYLVEILRKGNEKAQVIASKTWDEVKYKLGLKYTIESKHIITSVNKQKYSNKLIHYIFCFSYRIYF